MGGIGGELTAEPPKTEPIVGAPAEAIAGGGPGGGCERLPEEGNRGAPAKAPGPLIGGPLVRGPPIAPDGGTARLPAKGEDDIKGLGRAACGSGTAPPGIPDEGKPLEGAPVGGPTEPPPAEGGIEGLDANDCGG